MASALDAPLLPLVVRKVGAPGHKEFGIGAVAPDGIRFADNATVRSLNLSREEFDRLADEEDQEVDRRLRRFHTEHLSLDGRTAILVDDGLATGVTAIAAARWIRSKHPARSILAVPVGSLQGVQTLEQEVDEVVCPLIPQAFFAVGQWYRRFDQTTDEEVEQVLRRSTSKT